MGNMGANSMRGLCLCRRLMITFLVFLSIVSLLFCFGHQVIVSATEISKEIEVTEDTKDIEDIEETVTPTLAIETTLIDYGIIEILDDEVPTDVVLTDTIPVDAVSLTDVLPQTSASQTGYYFWGFGMLAVGVLIANINKVNKK